MKIPRDPENIGWAGCIYINPDEKTILLVRNLKRESQLKKELLRQGYVSEEDQRRYRNKVIWELSTKKLLEKPSKWELLGGKIAYWQGNTELHEKFRKLPFSEQENFSEKLAAKVLYDDVLLSKAAAHTAESEFVEESGLVATEKVFLKRVNDFDRNARNNPDAFYPRFWYLVLKASDGELRKEPIKETVSAPQWVPLHMLHPASSRGGQFPFHPSHCLGVVAAARYLIKNGRPEFADVVNYLERIFGSQKEPEVIEAHSDWESFAETVQIKYQKSN